MPRLRMAMVGAAVALVCRAQGALNTDHEFDSGSRIELKAITPAQVENLVTLGKVWGFLKYHHREIVAGRRHWDYDLLRVMPAVIAAPDRATANAAILGWVRGLPAPAKCEPCAKLDPEGLQLRPDLDWMNDRDRLGGELSALLRAIHASRQPGGDQFYVTFNLFNRGFPEFPHELGYSGVRPGDSGFQILAAFRFWNVIEYWFAYRDGIGGSWDDALRQSLPKIALAGTRETYRRELLSLMARVHDSHTNSWDSFGERPPVGPCRIPVYLRWVESSAVVDGYRGEPIAELKPGDVITELDGTPIADLLKAWAPYYAASNDSHRHRDMMNAATRGDCGPAIVRVRREGREQTVRTARRAPVDESLETRQLPGETFRRLSEDVAYLKFSSIERFESPRYITAASGTKGLILDMRCYPSDVVVVPLGSLLVDRPTPYLLFTNPDPANPGAFRWNARPETFYPYPPHYAGKIVILVDEASMSLPEYTAVALRTAPGAMIVGNTTGGALGETAVIPLPGGVTFRTSTGGRFHPDKTPTQGVGAVPDVEVKPTIAGIKAGRDEALDEAIRQILGREVTNAQIDAMVK